MNHSPLSSSLTLRATLCALLLTTLGMAPLAHADEHDWRDGPGHSGMRHDGRGDQRDGEWRDGRRDAWVDQREGRINDRREYYNAYGPEFERGRRIPDEYRRPVYVVDYHEHHLSPPPHGHQWVQVGADYALIAIATGVIANIVLHH